MKRIIITGANGVGKSHFAARLSAIRPELRLIAFDALKLRTGWQQKPKSESDAALARAVEQSAWIVEGGPSVLPIALPRADALIWLAPPDYARAWNLLKRPWRSLGKTRPELPAGNVDGPHQQYRFALKSLLKSSSFEATLSSAFDTAHHIQKWKCRTEHDRQTVLRQLATAPDDS